MTDLTALAPEPPERKVIASWNLSLLLRESEGINSTIPTIPEVSRMIEQALKDWTGYTAKVSKIERTDR